MSECCRKKQAETQKDGSQVSRCINSKSKFNLTIVDDSACGGCPVKVACAASALRPQQDPAYAHPEYVPCEHRRQDTKTFVINCGVTGLPVTPEQCSACDKETRDRVATLGDKLVGYAGAIKRWVAAGRPTRTEEEIIAIFRDHCGNCEMYDKEKHSCKNCGCSLALTGNPLTNKLAMGTEHCPLGRW